MTFSLCNTMTLSFCNDTKRSVNFDIFQNVLYDFKILEEKEREKMAVDLKQIADNLIKGKAPEVKELVQKALGYRCREGS